MPDRWIDDHAGDEVRPRPDFKDELETTLRAAWSDREHTDPARRVSVHTPQRRGSRRLLVFTIGAAAVLTLAVSAVAVTRDDGSSTVPADPTVISGVPVPTEPTTAPMTTVEPPTNASVSTPSTASGQVAARSAFAPVCVDRLASPVSPSADPAVDTEVFGPLATTPALTIELPGVPIEPAEVAPSAAATQPPNVAVRPIPGGFLIVATAAIEIGSRHGSFVAAVNLDGSVRWLRCRDDDLAPGRTLLQRGPGAAVALVGMQRDGVPAGWQALALDDGRPMGSLADVAGGEIEVLSQSSLVLVQSESVALFDSTTAGPGGSAMLVALDLETLVATAVPDPTAAEGRPDGWTYRTDAAGRIALFGLGAEPSLPAFVLVGDKWMDVAVAAADDPPVVGFDVDMGSALRAVEASGMVVWTNPAVTRYGGEGDQVRVAADVTVVRGCVELAEEGFGCNAISTLGVRNVDGEVLWQRPGDHMLGPAADGYALIGTGPGPAGEPAQWNMIELATGSDVPGQRWDGEDTFGNGCCASYELHTERHGGIVIATTGQRISVYYPADAGLAPAMANIP